MLQIIQDEFERLMPTKVKEYFNSPSSIPDFSYRMPKSELTEEQVRATFSKYNFRTSGSLLRKSVERKSVLLLFEKNIDQLAPVIFTGGHCCLTGKKLYHKHGSTILVSDDFSYDHLLAAQHFGLSLLQIYPLSRKINTKKGSQNTIEFLQSLASKKTLFSHNEAVDYLFWLLKPYIEIFPEYAKASFVKQYSTNSNLHKAILDEMFNTTLYDSLL